MAVPGISPFQAALLRAGAIRRWPDSQAGLFPDFLFRQPVQKLADAQDFDPLSCQEPDQLPVSFEIVVAGDHRVGGAIPGGFDHHIVVWVSTETNRASDRDNLSPFSQE